jgi:hypothetical protein
LFSFVSSLYGNTSLTREARLTTSAAVQHKGNNIQLMAVRILETHNITTRKSAKTNGNTDGNIPSGIFGKLQRCDDVDFFR